MKPTAVHFLLLTVCGWVNRRQLAAIEYLRAENQVLKQQLGGRRPRFTDCPCRKRIRCVITRTVASRTANDLVDESDEHGSHSAAIAAPTARKNVRKAARPSAPLIIKRRERVLGCQAARRS